MAAKTYAWHTKREPVLKGGFWVKGPPVTQLVRVLARGEGYAMVRYTGLAPFVVRERDLEPCVAGDARNKRAGP